MILGPCRGAARSPWMTRPRSTVPRSTSPRGWPGCCGWPGRPRRAASSCAPWPTSWDQRRPPVPHGDRPAARRPGGRRLRVRARPGPRGRCGRPSTSCADTFPQVSPPDADPGGRIETVRDLSRLTERLQGAVPVTGGEWLSWARATASPGNIGLPERQGHELLARLVSELARSVSHGYPSRYEALVPRPVQRLRPPRPLGDPGGGGPHLRAGARRPDERGRRGGDRGRPRLVPRPAGRRARVRRPGAAPWRSRTWGRSAARPSGRAWRPGCSARWRPPSRAARRRSGSPTSSGSSPATSGGATASSRRDRCRRPPRCRR